MPSVNLPNGPASPGIIQNILWLLKPLDYLEYCVKKYGDIFTLRLGNKNQIFVSNPQAVQQIFNTDSTILEAGKSAGAIFPLLGENSIISLEGKPHERQRKLLMPPFHGERMRSYGNLIAEITDEVTAEWKPGESLKILPSMQEISLQVILKAVFGLKDSERYQEIKAKLIKIFNPSLPLLRALMLIFPVLRRDLGAWSPWGKYLRLRQQIDDLIYAEIQERRDNPDPTRNDILSMMMSARDEDGQPMTDVELRDELMTLLVAGHETTATSLSWAIYGIYNNPQVREKLLQELDNLPAKNDETAILKLPYLNAVVSETLRLYPTAILTFQRLIKAPIELMGYKQEPGNLLVACIYLTHRREDLYPNPKEFKPERFLERQFSPYEYYPFGGGNRRCLGLAFALFEMKLVLAKILSNYEIVLTNTKPEVPVRAGLLFRPSHGVPAIVKGKREQKASVLQTSAGAV